MLRNPSWIIPDRFLLIFTSLMFLFLGNTLRKGTFRPPLTRQICFNKKQFWTPTCASRLFFDCCQFQTTVFYEKIKSGKNVSELHVFSNFSPGANLLFFRVVVMRRTPYFFENHRCVETKPLLFRVSNFNGGREGFEG